MVKVNYLKLVKILYTTILKKLIEYRIFKTEIFLKQSIVAEYMLR